MEKRKLRIAIKIRIKQLNEADEAYNSPKNIQF